MTEYIFRIIMIGIAERTVLGVLDLAVLGARVVDTVCLLRQEKKWSSAGPACCLVTICIYFYSLGNEVSRNLRVPFEL